MSEVSLLGGPADGRVMDVPADVDFLDVLAEDELTPATFRRQSEQSPVERTRTARYRRANPSLFVPAAP